MEKETNCKAMAKTAMARSNIYALLAAVFRVEPSSDFLAIIFEPKILDLLEQSGVEFAPDVLEQPVDELSEELSVEFARLFLGPGHHISPHESVHRSGNDNGRLWGEATVRVKKFIETTGIEYQSGFNGIPDHVSVELEFLHEVCLREYQAWEEINNSYGRKLRIIQNDFLNEHLMEWIPQFCDKILEKTSSSFYKELAIFTKQFLDFEYREILENN